MKKVKLNSKLSFKKDQISPLNDDSLSKLNGGAANGGGGAGGGGAMTAGCSDGSLCRTMWNCTAVTCTNDCGTLSCQTQLFCTI